MDQMSHKNDILVIINDCSLEMGVCKVPLHHQSFEIIIYFFFHSVLRPLDYFSSYETGQSVGGEKTEEP